MIYKNGIHIRSKASGKIKEEQVIEMRELYKQGVSQKELKEKYGLSQSQISGILTYRFWRYI